MNCGQMWNKTKANVWTFQVTPVSNVVTLVGKLTTINWGANSVPTSSTTFDDAQLALGVPVPLKSGRTYIFDVYVMPGTNQTARIHTKSDFDGVVAVDDDCDRTAQAPVSEWKVRRL